MDRRSLVRELVRARVGELMGMTNKLDKIGTSLEKILRAQMELLSCMRKNKENIYALASEMGDIGVDHSRNLSFGWQPTK
ncbi:hypothetical protein PPTG_12629 [Phytophthora nicotianae INRA-310]|uniref:Uncharacterized protein n=1 Tax=Phytophthora nicotianae (strain INRA-310) TaxID=761204 RepID=W2PZY6_PHYN3|nr:hypothetical protein PPTG_12629 [Phytophthora nicotianae INRA-310]ETN06518.1 hypothetical protein PPTG_12629 [Phytophthora nicotianae INRA-310]